MTSITASLAKLQSATSAAEAAEAQLQTPRRIREKIDGLNTALIEAADEAAANKVLADIASAKRDLEVADILTPRKASVATAAWKLVQTECRNVAAELESALEPLAAKYSAAVDGVLRVLHPRATEWSPEIASCGLAVRLLKAVNGHHITAANRHGAEITGLAQEIEAAVGELPAAEAEVTRVVSLASKVGRISASTSKSEPDESADRELQADHH